MSRLNHENIVRYITSWIEPYGDVHKQCDLSTCLTASAWSSNASDSVSSTAWGNQTSSNSGNPLSSTIREDQSDGNSSWHPRADANHSAQSDGPSTSTQTDNREGHWSDSRHGCSGRPSLFIQLEWCQSSLADWLELRSTLQLSYGIGFALPHSSVRWLMDQIVRGVAYLHDQGILHRDLKPGNVLLKGPPLNRISMIPCGCRPGRQLGRSGTSLLPEMAEQEPAGWLPCYHYLVVKICDFGLTTILDNVQSERAMADAGGWASDRVFEPPSVLVLPRCQSAEDVSGLPSFSTFSCGRLGQSFREPKSEASSSKLLMTHWRRQHRHGSASGERNNLTALLTANLGSALYTAPEVKTEAGEADENTRLAYGYAADIYSMGVIFIQMLHTFSTVHELISILQQLGHNEVSGWEADLLSAVRLSWPLESELVVRMLSAPTNVRPTAQELLITLSPTSELLDVTRPSADNRRAALPRQLASVHGTPPPPPPPFRETNDLLSTGTSSRPPVSMAHSHQSWTQRYINELLWEIKQLRTELADTRLRLSRYEPVT